MAQQKKINQLDSNNNSNSKTPNEKPVRPTDEGETTTSSNSSQPKSNSQSSSYYDDVVVIKEEVNRKWEEIPYYKQSYTERTETHYHQKWPFNSYIDERKEAVQALEFQSIPHSNAIIDWANDKKTQAVLDILPSTYTAIAPVKTVYNVGKYFGLWGKKKDDSNDPYNGRKAAGCASVVFLQLLYYYKDLTEIKNNFPKLSQLYPYYGFDGKKFVKKDKNNVISNLTNSDVEVVRSLMEKICKAIPASFFTELGTAVLPIFFKQAAKNLGFSEFFDPLKKPNNEDAARYMYQSLCNGILPTIYLTESDHNNHYAIVDGCRFDNKEFNASGSYAKACSFYWNSGHSAGSVSLGSGKVDIMASKIMDDNSAEIKWIYFYAPKKKFVYNEYTGAAALNATHPIIPVSGEPAQLLNTGLTKIQNLYGGIDNCDVIDKTITSVRKGDIVGITRPMYKDMVAATVISTVTGKSGEKYAYCIATKTNGNTYAYSSWYPYSSLKYLISKTLIAAHLELVNPNDGKIIGEKTTYFPKATLNVTGFDEPWLHNQTYFMSGNNDCKPTICAIQNGNQITVKVKGVPSTQNYPIFAGTIFKPIPAPSQPGQPSTLSKDEKVLVNTQSSKGLMIGIVDSIDCLYPKMWDQTKRMYRIKLIDDTIKEYSENNIFKIYKSVSY